MRCRGRANDATNGRLRARHSPRTPANSTDAMPHVLRRSRAVPSAGRAGMSAPERQRRGRIPATRACAHDVATAAGREDRDPSSALGAGMLALPAALPAAGVGARRTRPIAALVSPRHGHPSQVSSWACRQEVRGQDRKHGGRSRRPAEEKAGNRRERRDGGLRGVAAACGSRLPVCGFRTLETRCCCPSLATNAPHARLL